MNEAKRIRHLEAIERQKFYDSRSLLQKIALCKSRRGNSAKELKKLEKLI